MKKIFLTGGSGFIGSHFAEKLCQLGYEVTVFDIDKPPSNDVSFINGDIRNFELLKKSMLGHDTVCHLAAMLGVVACSYDKDTVYSVNLEGTRNIINACKLNNIEHLLSASSSEVYGEGSATDKLHEEMVLKPKSYYGMAKMMSEAGIKSFCDNTGAKATVLRYCNVYGPRQKNVFVIPIFIDNVLNNKPLPVCGDGSQVRSFTYIADAVDGTIRALLRSNENFKIYNIASSMPITINQLAFKIIEIHGGGTIEYLTFQDVGRKKEFEILTRIPSIEKAENELGYNPKTSIDQGLRLTYDYYLDRLISSQNFIVNYV